MKKLTILIAITLFLGSCNDSRDMQESHSVLEKQFNTKNIYDINPFDHIIFNGDSIIYVKTWRSGHFEYSNRIK